MADDENDGDDERGETRLLASCDSCGAVYAAVETADGTIIPIGNREGCRCGGTEFSSLNESLESDESDESDDPETDTDTGGTAASGE